MLFYYQPWLSTLKLQVTQARKKSVQQFLSIKNRQITLNARSRLLGIDWMSTWKVVALLKFVKWRFFRQRQVRMRNFHSFSNRCFFMNQDTHDCKRLKNLRNTWSLYYYFIDRPFVRLFLSNILILFSVNLAAKRPAKASQDNDNAYRGCDQKIGIVLFCTQMCIYLQTFYHNKLFACSVFTNLVR